MKSELLFFEVQTWSKLAENCYNLGHKGRGVRVVGRLKQERWIDSEGKSHGKVIIVAEHIEFRPEFTSDAGTTLSGASRSEEGRKDYAETARFAFAR